MRAAKHAAEKNKLFAMNLSAPFLLQVPGLEDHVLGLLPYMDIVFGNETEGACLGEAHGWKDASLAEVAKKASLLPKENKDRKRIVIITQGADPMLVAQEGEVKEFPVVPIKQEE